MGDKLRKVRRGEPLRIPAATFNCMIDAAGDFADRMHRMGAGAAIRACGVDTGEILVRNDSGADVEGFAILGVDSIVISPTDSLDEFKNRPILSVITPAVPDHAEPFGKFVILAEPLAHVATEADRPIGRAVIDGLSVVKIDVQHADHEFAVIVDGQSTKLESAVSGAVQIIYKESGTGGKWAVVRIGGRRDRGFWAEITGNAADGTNRWKYAWSEVYKSGAGYGGWSTLTGGRSGTTGTNPARNTIEDMNTGGAAHVEGCGVDVDHLDTDDWTFAIMPCTTGNKVWMISVPYGTGTEFWFAHVNGVDGVCD